MDLVLAPLISIILYSLSFFFVAVWPHSHPTADSPPSNVVIQLCFPEPRRSRERRLCGRSSNARNT